MRRLLPTPRWPLDLAVAIALAVAMAVAARAGWLDWLAGRLGLGAP